MVKYCFAIIEFVTRLTAGEYKKKTGVTRPFPVIRTANFI